MKALGIINRWIEYATSKKLAPHTRHFWNARDIIEGTFSRADIINETIMFIKTLDDTEQRNAVIYELQKRSSN